MRGLRRQTPASIMAAIKTETPASELERRKQVKLRLRTDLVIAPQKYEGRTYYVVKDPVSLRYYRFKEQEHFLIRLMDGEHTLDQAQKDFEKRFRPDRLTLEDLEQFGQQLLTAGLAQNESPNAGKQLFDRRKKRRRTEILQTLTNILYIKIPVFDPEKLLRRMVPYFRFMFTYWFLALSVCFMLSALVLVATHWKTFHERLPSFHEFFSFKTVVYLWAALGVVKVIHEFGHGLSCKMFGGEVHEMGALFLCFSPCLYCNVSDSWTLPNKWKRIIISGAGIYVELMIAAAATWVWWYTPSQPFINYLSLCLMVVCSVSTVMFNGNPLMRYDGYYVLADWLEIPNLRDRSNRYLSKLFQEHCLGIEVQPEPYMALGRRILFVAYALVSYVYRWVVTFVILYFMSKFLEPYKLKAISNMLAVAAAASMVGWPLWRLGKNLYKRGRLPDMKRTRVTITTAVGVALLVGFFFLPLPFGRVRQVGLVQVQPDHLTPVSIEVPGLLKRVNVREGERVQKGTVLAEFSNVEKEFDLLTAQSNLNGVIERIRALKGNMGRAPDAQGRSRIEQQIGAAEAERGAIAIEVAAKENEVGKLVLRAPSEGVVMNVPKMDEIGKYFDRDSGKPFCQIADANKLRIVVPLAPSEYDVVRHDLIRRTKEHRTLDVTVRVHGHGMKHWDGVVSLLPEQEAKEIPVQLSNKAGGPLAVKPGAPEGKIYPQAQVFLVSIDLKGEPGELRNIRPGSMGQVKIHSDYRSGAWYVWRLINSTFDLGLM
jgi:putative peptide zinc metalloprotease protein